jgi:outer membrane protein assembly factor BamB
MGARSAGLAALVLAAAAVSGCGGVDEPGGRTTRTYDAEWRLPNVDTSNTRRVGGPIDAASVRRLRVAWRAEIGEVVANPVVARGVVYVQDRRSNVTAIALRNGRERWTQFFEQPTVGPNGVAVAGDRIYGATATEAFAQQASTGDLLWRRRLVRNAHEGIDMAPGLWRGTVYVSTVPANSRITYGAGARGTLWALDAATGRPRWRWMTVPRDLWGRPDVNSGGGLWHPPAFDEHGQLYASVGNPGPYAGTRRYPWGSSRLGPNRWTNSLVKLDARTGRFRWGRQVLPHDLYDWDLECPPILTRVGGRPLVIVAGKMGFVYAFRASGQLVWKRAVGVHNGHDADGRKTMSGGSGGLHSGERILPGELGGVETPMAVDGDTVYVPVENLASIHSGVEPGETESLLDQGAGELVALDLASGRVKWDRRLPESAWGGVVVVNDLVFTPTYEGTVWALRTADGSVAWKTRLPAGVIAPLAVVGDTLIAAAGEPLEPKQSANVVAYRLADDE